jgi:glycosyltransferase involved in cell wall biosynthesis
MNADKNDFVVYIGDFDFRNENVQSFLVRNNGKILNRLGYNVAYIGINTLVSSFNKINKLEKIEIENGNTYLELPTTLSLNGIKRIGDINNVIIRFVESIAAIGSVRYVITYQAPSYSVSLNKIAKWCKKNGVPYVVNCADLPTFVLQPLHRRIVMKLNWDYMHHINKKYGDGLIAVSSFICEYYSNISNKVVIPPLFDSTYQGRPYFESTNIPSFVYAGTPFKITGKEANPKGMKDRLDIIIDYFIELTKMKVPFYFQIVGIEKEDYIRGVPRHQKQLLNNPSIFFAGRKSHEETLRIVSKSDFSINYRDVTIMTKAGFSTKIVESVSLGTPVIINDISDSFNYLEDGKTGFLLTGTAEHDIRKLSSLCKLSRMEREALKKETLEKQLFNYEHYIQQMDSFLKAVTKVNWSTNNDKCK